MLSPEIQSRLKRPDAVRSLLTALASDDAATYELLFHAAFADRLFGVMRSSRPDAEGFGRMQQTFGDAVEKVRSAIALAEKNGFFEAKRYTEISGQAMSNLLELMHDLSIVKQSSNKDDQ